MEIIYTPTCGLMFLDFSDLEESARTSGAVKRCRRLPNAEALIRMGMAYAVSDLSLKDVAAWARALEIAFISGPGLHYRLRTAESWFESLLVKELQSGVESKPVGIPVEIVDATVITPGLTVLIGERMSHWIPTQDGLYLVS